VYENLMTAFFCAHDYYYNPVIELFNSVIPRRDRGNQRITAAPAAFNMSSTINAAFLAGSGGHIAA
jgi:hypothetical protein